jgi:hypothetical protein
MVSAPAMTASGPDVTTDLSGLLKGRDTRPWKGRLLKLNMVLVSFARGFVIHRYQSLIRVLFSSYSLSPR